MSVIRESLNKAKPAVTPDEMGAGEPTPREKGESTMRTKILVSLGIVIFLLVFLNTVTVFYFYKQYSSNIEAINQEAGNTRTKLEDLEKESEAFRKVTEAIGSQVKGYEQSILSLENRINLNESSANDLAEKIQGTKAAIDDWQKKLESALSLVVELRDSTEKLVSDVEEIKKMNTSVDLGKIAVQKGGSRKGR